MKLEINMLSKSARIESDERAGLLAFVQGRGTEHDVGDLLQSLGAGGRSDLVNHVGIRRQWLEDAARANGPGCIRELEILTNALNEGAPNNNDSDFLHVLTQWPIVEGHSLWEIVRQRAELTPDLEFLCDERGERTTFRGCATRAEEVAAGLRDLGLSSGDVVSWVLPTWSDAVVLAMALSRIGVIQNPIVPIYREREVAFCTTQTGARMLIVTHVWRGFDYAAMAEGVAAANDDLSVLVVERDGLPVGDVSKLEEIAPLASNGTDVGWLMYTSGTTADPKGAKITDSSISHVAQGMCLRMDVRYSDRISMVFPFAHLGGITWMFGAQQYGFTMLLEEAFRSDLTPEYLSREGCTHAGTGTAFHLAYLNAQRARGAEKLFPRLKNCPGGGSPKPPQLHYDIKRELGGAGIISSWGLTEAQILTFATPWDDDEKLANTEGRPMPGVELITVDQDGKHLPLGTEGELCAKGPQVLQGYVDSNLDAQAFDTSGYFRTGDVGFIDHEGYVTITGRLKDIIIRNGENISAKELEDLLYTHPKVGEVAIIGLPDAKTGERVCAVVAPKSAQDPPTFLELRDFLMDSHIRMQAIPEQLEVIGELPRNASGKVLKNVLRKSLEGPLLKSAEPN
jgi:acyl-CoA synthetase (AMP-forming)/AMP-acid ligase II